MSVLPSQQCIMLPVFALVLRWQMVSSALSHVTRLYFDCAGPWQAGLYHNGFWGALWGLALMVPWHKYLSPWTLRAFVIGKLVIHR